MCDLKDETKMVEKGVERAYPNIFDKFSFSILKSRERSKPSWNSFKLKLKISENGNILKTYWKHTGNNLEINWKQVYSRDCLYVNSFNI